MIVGGIVQYAWRSPDRIEQSRWRLQRDEAEQTLARRGGGEIVERRVSGCAGCGETRATHRGGRCCGDIEGSVHAWREASEMPLGLAEELAGMPEDDRRVADQISDLAEIEPTPGYEERAVERARREGVLPPTA